MSLTEVRAISPIEEDKSTTADVRAAAVERVAPAAKEDRRALTLAEESFRTLRSNLLLHTGGARTVVLTSATPSEGKSTIAVNLACALAAARRSVLLVDADLRRPSIHRFFQLSNTPGLADVLKGRVTAEDAWQVTPQGPTVLTSGGTPSDPQTLLGSGALESFLAAARKRFDMVVLDSAPVLAVSDTTLVVPHADATVLVVKYATISESEAALAVDRIRAARGNVIGCVMSQVSEVDDSFNTYNSYYAAND